MTGVAQLSGILLLAVIVGLAAGALFGVQPSVNGELSRHVAHPLQASIISFASGTLALLAIAIVGGIFPPRFIISPSQMPWWAWGSGLIGVFVVTSSLIMVPRVGSLPWFASVMTGQVIAAVLLDHYGWLGNQRAAATPIRLAGAAMLLIGLTLIVYAKRTEQLATESIARVEPTLPTDRDQRIP